MSAIKPSPATHDALVKAASAIRDAFNYDPGHSDLDNEQPIHISTTLGAWRRLNHALFFPKHAAELDANGTRSETGRTYEDGLEQGADMCERMARSEDAVDEYPKAAILRAAAFGIRALKNAAPQDRTPSDGPGRPSGPHTDAGNVTGSSTPSAARDSETAGNAEDLRSVVSDLYALITDMGWAVQDDSYHIITRAAALLVSKPEHEKMEREHLGDPDKRTGIYSSAPSAEERTHPAVEQVYENWHVYLRGVDRPDFRKQLYRLADAIVAGTAEALSARSSAPAIKGWPPFDIAKADFTFEELWKLGQRLLSARPSAAGIDAEAITWALGKLEAFGLQTKTENALMMDRLKLMVLDSSAPPAEADTTVVPGPINRLDVDAYVRSLEAKDTPWSHGCASMLESLWQAFNNERMQRESSEQSRDQFRKCWQEECARSATALTLPQWKKSGACRAPSVRMLIGSNGSWLCEDCGATEKKPECLYLRNATDRGT